MPTNKAARWGAVSVFALASTWNYLDRQVLNSAGPAVIAEFHLSKTQFGWLISAFSIAYALASPATGWLLDWLGLEIAIMWSVAMWSVSSILGGLSRGFGQLLGTRVMLGAFESAGVPAAGKLNASYLEPENRAIGAAMTQVGLSIAGFAAPWLVAATTGWRQPFYICAALGLLWIPVFLLTKRRIAPFESVPPQRETGGLQILRDPRLQRIVIANMLWMGSYSFWTNWTTVFLTGSFHLTLKTVAPFAWIPPVAATLGAFAGGWISRQAIRRGRSNADARILGTLISAVGCLVVLAMPFCTTPQLATFVASVSSFWAVAGSVNLYTIPVDIWGPERAGTAVSALVFGYGVLQAGISPAIGWSVDHLHSYDLVFRLLAPMPLMAWWLLRRLRTEQS